MPTETTSCPLSARISALEAAIEKLDAAAAELLELAKAVAEERAKLIAEAVE